MFSGNGGWVKSGNDGVGCEFQQFSFALIAEDAKCFFP